MKRITTFSILAVLAAMPAFAKWTITGGLDTETMRVGNEFYATDGTWDLKFQRGTDAAYSCKNNTGTGGAVLDLTTFVGDMAAAGVTWSGKAITLSGLSIQGFMNVSALTELRLPATVTSFGNQCLSGTGLTGEFVIPDSITTIGQNVFANCQSLTKIVMNENIKEAKDTFYACPSLVEVKIPSGMTKLADNMFRDCPALTTVYADVADRAVGSVVLPATVKTLGASTFRNDASIVRIVAPGVTSYSGDYTFGNCKSLEEVDLPEMTGAFGGGTFADNTALRRVNSPKCTGIGSQAFLRCPALVELCVSPSFKTLGSGAFRSSTSFRTLYTNEATKVEGHVQLPATCTGGIAEYTFFQTKIERIDAPGITSISGEKAFSECKFLEEVHLPSLTSMAKTYAFSSCPLRVLEIGPSLAGMIGEGFFQNCYSLETIYQSGNAPVVGLVDLPVGVTMLAKSAFQQCRSINHVVAPGVTDIGDSAFASCLLLETARFSPDLAYLRSYVGSATSTSFYNCPKLVDFYPSTITNLTSFSTGTFNGCTSLTNFFDFSGCTLANPANNNNLALFQKCQSIAGVKLPSGFCRLDNQAFGTMRPGAEIHFTGDIPTTFGNENNALWQGSDAAGYRYKIFADAATYPAWTNGTKTAGGWAFTPVTAAMESESDYPGIATIGYLTLQSKGKNNWLVQEPFYVDVTFYDEDGTTALGIEKTLLGTAPAWSGETPTKASTAQYSYVFAGWSKSVGGAVVDLATLAADAPMSLYAVYAPSTRSYTITWQWNDGSATQSDSTIVTYGETPSHAAVERAATTEHTYSFLGWSTDGTTVLATIPPVSEATTYIAVFEQKDATTTVTVRWLNDDRETLLGTTWPEKGTAAVAPLTPKKDASVSTTYTFAGWSTDGATVLADLTVSADTNFIAVYTPSVRRYTVSFVDWDGAAIASADYDYETPAASVVAPSNPVRAADAENTYLFAAWSPEIADVTGDATYTATYTATPKTYAATFVDWNGTVLAGPTDYAVGAAVAAPADPEREGHTFAGWSPAVGAMPAANTTYTATYTLNKYIVKFVNGDSASTASYDYGTPASSISFPAGTKTSTSKFYYRFVEWEPAPETVQSNTTYTARFAALVGKPMTLALSEAAFDTATGTIGISATLGNATAAGAVPAPALSAAKFSPSGAAGDSFDGTAGLEDKVYTAELGDVDGRSGYNWTATVEQDWSEYGTKDVAVLRGRTYAKRRATWFNAADVSWDENGVFKPAKTFQGQQQVRIRAAFAVPPVAPPALPDATGQIVGIGVKSFGGAPAWYGWTGAKWVKLVGADPPAGGTAQILTVADFAARSPTVTWYADGLPLTTEDGEWAIPLAGGDKIGSFTAIGGKTVSSLSGDYDVGGLGFSILVR